MKLELHYAPRACSLVPFITLTEAGAPFEVVNVNMARREHLEPAFLKVNPKHKVPVLSIDGAYFSQSWTAFQADRGRDFSVIVDGVSN